MATQPIGEQQAGNRRVSVEEYLSTSYEPDCGFEDGVVVERNLGEFEHSFLQTILAALFTNNIDRWGVFGLTEQRIQIDPRHFLVPDVCVLKVGAAADDILAEPPLIALEIISPEDTIRRAANKAATCLHFGIEHVWVIGPHARVAYRGTESGLQRVPNGELTVPDSPIQDSPIQVRIDELFSKLGRIRKAGSTKSSSR
jgi:Uma2 family endonuclease